MSIYVPRKRCSVCGKKRKLSDFHRRSKTKDVRSSRCRFCAATAQRKWRRGAASEEDRRDAARAKRVSTQRRKKRAA
jgi:hypothetical protein